MTVYDETGAVVFDPAAPAPALAPQAPAVPGVANLPAVAPVPSSPASEPLADTPPAPDDVGAEPAAPTATPEQIASAADNIGKFFSKTNLGAEHSAALGDWINATYQPGAAPPSGQQVHAYDLRAFTDFSADDMPYVHSFLNMAASRGMLEEQATGMLNEYLYAVKQVERKQRRERAAPTPNVRELAPVDLSLPNSQADLDNEISEIHTTMKLNRLKYNRDEKMQQRYRDLLTKRHSL